jgi:hypothetical protein
VRKRVAGKWFTETFSVLLPPCQCVFVGTGVQLICMSVAALTFSMLRLLSPENRGSLTTAFILLFVFMRSFADYHSSSIYKMQDVS